MTPSDTPLPWKLKPVDGDLKKDADDHQAFWVSVPSDQIYLLVKRWEVRPFSSSCQLKF